MSYIYDENAPTEMTLRDNLHYPCTRNFERWSRAQEFMDAISKRVFRYRIFTNSLALSVKKRITSALDEWRLTANEKTCSKDRLRAAAPPLPLITSSSKGLQDLVHRKLERVHARSWKTRSQKVMTAKYNLYCLLAPAHRRLFSLTRFCLRIAAIDVR